MRKGSEPVVGCRRAGRGKDGREMDGLGRRREYLVEREAWIARDGEVAVESYVLDFFLGFSVCVFMSTIARNSTLKSANKVREEVRVQTSSDSSATAYQGMADDAQLCPSSSHFPHPEFNSRTLHSYSA